LKPLGIIACLATCVLPERAAIVPANARFLRTLVSAATVNMIGQFATDCSPFFTFAPLTVAPLIATMDFAMFTVTTQNLQGEADFSVDEAPEPGTAALLASAGIAMAAPMRRRVSVPRQPTTHALSRSSQDRKVARS